MTTTELPHTISALREVCSQHDPQHMGAFVSLDINCISCVSDSDSSKGSGRGREIEQG